MKKTAVEIANEVLIKTASYGDDPNYVKNLTTQAVTGPLVGALKGGLFGAGTGSLGGAGIGALTSVLTKKNPREGAVRGGTIGGMLGLMSGAGVGASRGIRNTSKFIAGQEQQYRNERRSKLPYGGYSNEGFSEYPQHLLFKETDTPEQKGEKMEQKGEKWARRTLGQKQGATG